MLIVLVVDDDAGIASLLERIINKRGYQTFVAYDGKQGLEFARKYHPDLIFTDIKMPDMDGEELTSLIKADPVLADIPIIFLSGTAFLIDLESSLADAILNKPFEIKAVYALLDRFLPFPPTAATPSKTIKTELVNKKIY